jgi:hypothetical protein
MALVNKYFHQSNLNEQSILNSVVKESIKTVGRVYQYLPRDGQVTDLILGEDVISSFTLAIPLEMYLKDAQGYGGQREMFSKFGLQIQNSYKLVVSVDRWNQEVKSRFDGLTLNQATFSLDNYVRPHEGDLIYDPLTKFLMVITFVDHDAEFYSLGRNYVYYLSCESYMYQNEFIATSVPEIDAYAALSMDNLMFQILSEDGGALMIEFGGNYILQEESPQPSEPTRSANTDYIVPAAGIKTFVNNPFGL